MISKRRIAIKNGIQLYVKTLTFQVTKLEAAVSVFEYIETWYNTHRIHTTLKMSIRDYEEIYF